MKNRSKCHHRQLVRSGKRVLLVTHGNSLRALVKHLGEVSDADIVELNIPAGIPLVYELDEDSKSIRHEYLTHHVLAAQPPTTIETGDSKMPFEQPPLPFEMNAMKRFLSEEQLMYHYGKHHAAYFKNLNVLVEGKPEAGMSLRELVMQSTGPMFNNAAQAWNHSFYWNCLSPEGGGQPQGDLAAAIQRDFGSFTDFRQAMSEAAVKLFGSGWAWLAADTAGKLQIVPLGNADTPLKRGTEPVLTIDVWEHAYYIDFRNDRAKYVDGFWKAANWDFAGECYAAAVT